MRGALAFWSAIALVACGDDASGSDHDPDEILSGGAATVADDSRMAYAQALPQLHGDREDDFFVGNALFNRSWVTAPASVAQADGLGPLFNATNCSACHLKDGRGRPPRSDDEAFTSMLLRLSLPDADAQGAQLGDPIYGGQLQDNGIPGVPPEARPRVRYVEQPGAFADGTPYSLRKPTYVLESLAYGPLAPGVLMSPRVAPAVFGLGLLAALSDETLAARADPDDRDGDGISGRLNYVWDLQRGAPVIGRFGWKANQPTILQQTAAAFQNDIGVSARPFLEQPCSATQTACKAQPTGEDAPGAPEVTDQQLASVVHYMHTLAVPARRGLEQPAVKRGKKVFLAAGCDGCHVPKLRTGVLADFPELSNQSIRPYTDLLLHDMGEGLADGRPDFEASGSEWRTPPLWGIGLVQTVNQHAFFLHDGRARGLLEAILWHGGEAEAARIAVEKLPTADREALIAFLESL
jgi:CxxC motif-containing protein (DUF1111 family)